jgi:hypothetical protein
VVGEEEGTQEKMMVEFHIIFFRDNQSFNSQRRENIYDNNHLIFYKPKQVDKSKVKCFRYHGYGHYKFRCQTNLNMSGGKKSNLIKKKKMKHLIDGLSYT